MPFKEVFAEGIKIAYEAETSDTHENAKEKHTKYFEGNICAAKNSYVDSYLFIVVVCFAALFFF